MQQETNPVPGTPLPFEQAENFRQLGGYAGAEGKRVKNNVFYRSGALCDAVRTPHDKALLESLGLKVICDLRSSQEREQMPDPDVPGARRQEISAMTMADGQEINFDLASFFTLPAEELDAVMDQVQRGYADMPFGNEAYKGMFRYLCDGDVPLLFHCTAGKDRTGVAAMLILKTLGVSDEDVMADYLQTNVCRAQSRAALQEKFAAALGGQLDESRRRLVGLLTGVEAEALQLTMDAIRGKYLRFEDYLLAEYGIDEQMLARLRRMYLE